MAGPQGAGRAVAAYLRKYVAAPRYRAAEVLALTTDDGVGLYAHRLAGPPSAPATVVVVHGFAGWSRNPSVHAFATRLAERYEVLVPDLRGHGRSGGRSVLGGAEFLDVKAAVDSALAVAPARPVVTIGTSLGAAACLVHAGLFGGVAGVVSVSSPAWWAEPDRSGLQRVHRYVTSPAGRAAMAALLRVRIADECGTRQRVVDLAPAIAPAFTLVVHDPDDWYFGQEHAEAIAAAAAEPKELWWRPGGGHGTDLLDEALVAKVHDVVASALAAGAPSARGSGGLAALVERGVAVAGLTVEPLGDEEAASPLAAGVPLHERPEVGTVPGDDEVGELVDHDVVEDPRRPSGQS